MRSPENPISMDIPQRPPLLGSIYHHITEPSLYDGVKGAPSEVWTPWADVAYVDRLSPILDTEKIIRLGVSQLVTAADEHANRSVISTHHGMITRHTLMMNGFDMLEATTNALKAQPDDARVRAEYDGLRTIHELLQIDDKPQVILSPPKAGMSYGLGFIFIPKPMLPDGSVPVTQKIIMYQESASKEMGASQHIRDTLQHTLGRVKDNVPRPQTPEDYIRSPIRLDRASDEASVADARMVSLFGSHPADIARATLFRETLQKDMSQQLREYGECMVRHLNAKRAGDNKGAIQAIQRAKYLQDLVFTASLKLSFALQTGQHEDYNRMKHAMRDGGLAHAVVQEMMQPYLYMVADTQCPPAYVHASGGNTGMDIVGLWHKDLLAGMGGRTHGEWVRRDCVTCPCCNMQSTKDQPHLYHPQKQKWICGNASCKEHNASVYNTIVNGVPLTHHGAQQHPHNPSTR